MVKDIGSRVVGHWILHNRQATIHTPLPFRLLVPILHITTYRRILPHIFGSVLHNKPLSGNWPATTIAQHLIILAHIRILSPVQKVILIIVTVHIIVGGGRKTTLQILQIAQVIIHIVLVLIMQAATKHI